MALYLPSDIARLVYGYLVSQDCLQAAQSFLENSQYLKECLIAVRKGRQFHTKIDGRTLDEALDTFSDIIYLVNSFVLNNSGEETLTPVELVNKILVLLKLDGEVNSKTLSKNSFVKDCEKSTVFDLQTHHHEGRTTPRKATPEKRTSNQTNTKDSQRLTQEDLFDLNVLDTLISNTVLHEKIAENINKAKKSDICDEDSTGIVKAALNNTEADPIFEQVIKEIVAVVPSENSSQNSGDARIDCEDENEKTYEEKRLEEEKEVVSNIISSGEEVRRRLSETEENAPVHNTSIADKPDNEKSFNDSSGLANLRMNVTDSSGKIDESLRQDEVLNCRESMCKTPNHNRMEENNADSSQLAVTPISVHVLPASAIMGGSSQSSFLNIHGLMMTPKVESGKKLRPILPKPETSEKAEKKHFSPIKIQATLRGVRTRGGRRKLMRKKVKALVPQIERINRDNYHIDLGLQSGITVNSLRPRRGRPPSNVTPDMIRDDLLEKAKRRYKDGTAGSLPMLDPSSEKPVIFTVNSNVEIEESNAEMVENITESVECTPVAIESGKRSEFTENYTDGGDSGIAILKIVTGVDTNLDVGSESHKNDVELDNDKTENDEKDNNCNTSSGNEDENLTVYDGKMKYMNSSHDCSVDIDGSNVPKPQCSNVIGNADDVCESDVQDILIEEKNTSKEENKETPQFVARPLRSRLSLSSPRKGSHIRALDFKTPDKFTHPRKAHTSPKEVSLNQLKSLRALHRKSLFKSPLKKKASSAKSSWDADLRSFCPPSEDDPPKSRRKSSTNKKVIKRNWRRKSIPRKRAEILKEVSEEAEKKVQEIIYEEEEEGSEFISNLISASLPEDGETGKCPEEFAVPKNFIQQTPAKLDEGLLPPLMTPLTKIIKEQTSLLDNTKLLTPSFMVTPDFAKVDGMKIDNRCQLTPNPKERLSPVLQSSVDNPSSSIEKQSISPNESTSLNCSYKTPNKSCKSEDDSAPSLKSSPKKTTPQLPVSILNKSAGTNSKSPVSKFPRVRFNNISKAKKEKEKKQLIDECLKSVAYDMFTPSKIKTPKKLDSSCVKKSKKFSDSSSSPDEMSLELPSFTEMVKRYEKMTYLHDRSEDSSDSDSTTSDHILAPTITKEVNPGVLSESSDSDKSLIAITKLKKQPPDKAKKSALPTKIKSASGKKNIKNSTSGPAKTILTPCIELLVNSNKKSPQKIHQKTLSSQNIDTPKTSQTFNEIDSLEDNEQEPKITISGRKASNRSVPKKVLQNVSVDKKLPNSNLTSVKRTVQKKKTESVYKRKPNANCSPVQNNELDPSESNVKTTKSKKCVSRKLLDSEQLDLMSSEQQTELKNHDIKMSEDSMDPKHPIIRSPDFSGSKNQITTSSERYQVVKYQEMKSSEKSVELKPQETRSSGRYKQVKRLETKPMDRSQESKHPETKSSERSKDLKQSEKRLSDRSSDIKHSEIRCRGLENHEKRSEIKHHEVVRPSDVSHKKIPQDNRSLEERHQKAKPLDKCSEMKHKTNRSSGGYHELKSQDLERLPDRHLEIRQCLSSKEGSKKYIEDGKRRDREHSGRHSPNGRKHRDDTLRDKLVFDAKHRHYRHRSRSMEIWKRKNCKDSYGRYQEEMARRGYEKMLSKMRRRSRGGGISRWHSPSRRRSPTGRHSPSSPEHVPSRHSSDRNKHSSQRPPADDHSHSEHRRMPRVKSPHTDDTPTVKMGCSVKSPSRSPHPPLLIDPRLSNPRVSTKSSIYKNISLSQQHTPEVAANRAKRKKPIEREDGEISDSDASNQTYILKRQKIAPESPGNDSSFTSVDRVSSEKGMSLLEKVGVDRFLSIVHGSP